MYIGGGSSSLLPRNSIGGGKATLKDRGDVVLAGTRRVFAHVARKENFSAPRQCLTYLAHLGERKRKNKTEVKKERRRKRNVRYFDRSREGRRGSQQVREKDRECLERGGKRGDKWSMEPEVSAPLPGLS